MNSPAVKPSKRDVDINLQVFYTDCSEYNNANYGFSQSSVGQYYKDIVPLVGSFLIQR